jgi:hypothetical protein
MFTLMGVCPLIIIFGTNDSCRTNEGADMERNDRLATGIWGGEHIRVEVTDSGADIEFDCAHGSIDQPIVLDSRGTFNVKGKYTPQHGGPIQRDEENNDRLVRYVGLVKDQEMTLTISNDNLKETIGSFTLTHGSEGKVMKCR